MLKVASMVDVDTFIEQATKIADKVKRNPNLSTGARQEARILLEQLEEFLEARGLDASDSTEAKTCRRIVVLSNVHVKGRRLENPLSMQTGNSSFL